MKRRDFLLVRDVLRATDAITPDQRRILAREFGAAIADQPGTDPNFDARKFAHEVTRSGPERPVEAYDPARDPNAAFVNAVTTVHNANARIGRPMFSDQ